MSHDSMHVEAAQASASERGKKFYHSKEFLMFSTQLHGICKRNFNNQETTFAFSYVKVVKPLRTVNISLDCFQQMCENSLQD